MQSKTMIICQCTNIRTANIFLKSDNTNTGKNTDKLDPSIHFLSECKHFRHYRKHIWLFLTKLNMHLPYDSAIMFLGISLREIKLVHKY